MISLLPTFARAVGSIPFVGETVENRLSHQGALKKKEKKTDVPTYLPFLEIF
jgi:hypothetical protein